MQRPLIAAAMLLAAVQPTFADACKDKFGAFLIGSVSKANPGVARITNEFRGKLSESAFTFLAPDHYMYKPVKPDRGMWVLAWKSARYSSKDKGKTWKKIAPLDPDKEKAHALKTSKMQANTATNVTCAEETINGVVHDVYKADIKISPSVKTLSRNTYWVSRKISMAVKSIYVTGSKGSERVTTQYWKPAGDATLPKPK